jgi:hypothetical protein
MAQRPRFPPLHSEKYLTTKFTKDTKINQKNFVSFVPFVVKSNGAATPLSSAAQRKISNHKVHQGHEDKSIKL